MEDELRMKFNKEQKHFFEKELLWKYPVMFLFFIISIGVLKYLDNTRSNPDLLVGIFALISLFLLFGLLILGIFWIWFSVKPFLYKILISTQR